MSSVPTLAEDTAKQVAAAGGEALGSQVGQVADAAGQAVQLHSGNCVHLAPPDCGRKLVQGVAPVLPARDAVVHELDGFGAAALRVLAERLKLGLGVPVLGGNSRVQGDPLWGPPPPSCLLIVSLWDGSEWEDRGASSEPAVEAAVPIEGHGEWLPALMAGIAYLCVAANKSPLVSVRTAVSDVQVVGGALAKEPGGLDDERGISKAAKPSHPWIGHLGHLSKVSR